MNRQDHGYEGEQPYSRNEQRYIDAGADPDTARLAAQCYPDAKSKQDLYNKYKKQGYSGTGMPKNWQTVKSSMEKKQQRST